MIPARWGDVSGSTLAREARAVAAQYGMPGARLEHLQTSENRVWRVRFGGESYLLRCHRPAALELACLPTVSARQIEAELRWLDALRDRASFSVPMPVATTAGELVVTRAQADGQPLHWSLLNWVPGRQYAKGITMGHMIAAGRMAAELHAIAREAKLPNLDRPSWDEARLRRAVEEIRPLWDQGIINEDLWNLVLACEREVTQLMRNLNKSPSHGLIHGDLTIQNVVFHQGRCHPIDFCSCGYGDYAYDVGHFLAHAPTDSYWEAFGEGYAQGAPNAGETMAHARPFAGMAFVMWLNFNAPMRLEPIAGRLPRQAARVRELLG